MLHCYMNNISLLGFFKYITGQFLLKLSFPIEGDEKLRSLKNY